jgi:CoA:oxalate CoA-transferase
MPLGRRMLEGYRVLDFTQFVAGPACTRVLVEMSAEVIKIEIAPDGDRVRGAGLKSRRPEYADSTLSTYYLQHNQGKLSLGLDLKKPAAREVGQSLIPKVDVVAENFAPGLMARMGFSYQEVRRLNPSIVMVSISMAGQTGPLAEKPGYDYIGQAYAGITDGLGEKRLPPVVSSMAIGDISTGVAAAMAVGFALLHREPTGEGQYLDASLLDTYFHMHEMNVPMIALLGEQYRPTRNGSLHPHGGPAGVFTYCSGQYVFINVVPHQWQQFVKALGLPELESDARFRTHQDRVDNRLALKEIIEGWLATFPSRDAAILALEKERVPCAPVLSVNEAMAHPHLRARGTIRLIDPIQFLDAWQFRRSRSDFRSGPSRPACILRVWGKTTRECFGICLVSSATRSRSCTEIGSWFATLHSVREPDEGGEEKPEPKTRLPHESGDDDAKHGEHLRSGRSHTHALSKSGERRPGDHDPWLSGNISRVDPGHAAAGG